MSAKHLTIQQRAEIGTQYSEGLKTSTIAKIWGINTKDVMNIVHYLRVNGVQVPRRRKAYKKRGEQVVTFTKPEQEKFGFGDVIVLLVIVEVVAWFVFK